MDFQRIHLAERWHMWSEPEADRFAQIAIEMGVPDQNILRENRSTNTGENVSFTRELLAEKKLEPHSFIVVQKPYMERRSYATFRKVWPEKKVIVTSPQVSFAEYLNDYANKDLTPDDVVSIMTPMSVVGTPFRVKSRPMRLGSRPNRVAHSL